MQESSGKGGIHVRTQFTHCKTFKLPNHKLQGDILPPPRVSMAMLAADFRFGPYELRSRTQELYKDGVKMKLRPQPFQVLNALVERAGDVLTREELRELRWPKETFVDFEYGLIPIRARRWFGNGFGLNRGPIEFYVDSVAARNRGGHALTERVHHSFLPMITVVPIAAHHFANDAVDGLASEMFLRGRTRGRERHAQVRILDQRFPADANLQRGGPQGLEGRSLSIAGNAGLADNHQTDDGGRVIRLANTRVVADHGIRHGDVVSMRHAHRRMVNVRCSGGTGVCRNPRIGMFHRHICGEIGFTRVSF